MVSRVRGSNSTGIGASVMAMNLFAILVMLTLALSVTCRENIADTLLKIERHGSVANSLYDIFPVSFAFLYATVFRNLFAYRTFPSVKANLCSIARPSNQWLNFCWPTSNMAGPFLIRVPESQLGILPLTNRPSRTTSFSNVVKPSSLLVFAIIIFFLSCMDTSPLICSQNRLYLALTFYLIFQDFPKHMIGYVVLIPDSIEKIAICLDDGLFQLQN